MSRKILTGERKPVVAETSAPDAHPDAAQLLASIEELHAESRAEAARHSEELKQFTYAASHDLREPLRMVVTYTQLLRKHCEGKLEASELEFMQYIVEGAQRMERMLSDLLTYSHQLRPFEKPLVPVDPEAVLHSVLLALENEIREVGAKITYDGVSTVRSDFTSLAQVFRQLISNSMKFRGSDPPQIHISWCEKDEQVHFAFRDNGLGIDSQYHQEIFGPFKRMHGREYPGSGIGLAICRRIVEQHGGRIWVDSVPGQGALFQFELPK